ncbi:alpha/beta fold hydrolase [Actinomadura sp. NBRC 104425]|uniref:alpha/beta fold hydrolase n=1 Tax=Actinomadura sp. NBRC 104425 TaxID=3032204 RepID=UPI0033262BF2
MTWGTDDRYGFGAQRPLADAYRLLMVDRRGHGASPDIDRTDYEVDADDIVGLLTGVPGGAHLVGHSYGGVAVMLAAARRPDLVRSLTLIQPGALRPAADHPVVAEALHRSRQATAELPPDLSPEEYLRMSTEGLGLPMPEPTPERLRAVKAAMRETPLLGRRGAPPAAGGRPVAHSDHHGHAGGRPRGLSPVRGRAAAGRRRLHRRPDRGRTPARPRVLSAHRAADARQRRAAGPVAARRRRGIAENRTNAHRTGHAPTTWGSTERPPAFRTRCGGQAPRDRNPPIGCPLTERRETRHPDETT